MKNEQPTQAPGQRPEHFAVKTEVIGEIFQYLDTRPHGEVRKLFDKLGESIPINIQNPEPPEASPRKGPEIPDEKVPDKPELPPAA